MGKQIKLTILGEPKGKERPYATMVNGAVKTFTRKETVNYESKVVAEYKAQHDEMLFENGEEIWATIIAYFKIPKVHYRYHKRTNTTDLDKEGILMRDGKINPLKTPDTDNIAKICLDALNNIAYPDDSQITTLLVIKKYSEEPRVEITLESRGLNYESID